MPRRTFEITQEELDTIKKASLPVSVTLHPAVPQPPSPEQRELNAWKKLGERKNFDYKTIQQLKQNKLLFTAELKVTP